ncbi:Hypothetical protein SCF082_LOCUS13084 [Durusdinium trenchii]|uniref:Uncharacterized protein n=1 Tax=Durusdinium trenchii TaxID=1381693 RepID=A0ABP0JP38_9DINO
MPSWASTSSEPPRRAAPVPWAENGGTEPVLDLVLGARVGSPLVVSIGAFTKGLDKFGFNVDNVVSCAERCLSGEKGALSNGSQGKH